MLIDNTTLDNAQISSLMDPHRIVLAAKIVTAKEAAALESVDDHVATVRYGLRTVRFHATSVPTAEDKRENIWPYAALLPIPKLRAKAKKSKPIILVHPLEDAEPAVTTFVGSDGTVETRLQQIKDVNDETALRDALSTYAQKMGVADYEIRVISENDLKIPRLGHGLKGIDDYHAIQKSIKTYAMVFTICLVASLYLGADLARLNMRVRADTARLQTLQAEQSRVKAQLASLQRKIANEKFGELLRTERSLMKLLESLPPDCKIENHNPKRKNARVSYSCARRLEGKYKTKLIYEPGKKTAVVPIF